MAEIQTKSDVKRSAAAEAAVQAYLEATKIEAESVESAFDILPDHSAREAGFIVNRAGPSTDDAPQVIFFCPGMHGDDLAFFSLRRLLCRRYTVYSVRYRDNPPHVEEQYAKDVAEAIDALGLTRFHLIGESMGSIPSLQLAVQRPDAVLSLCLAGGFTHRVYKGLTGAGQAILPILPLWFVKFAGKTVLPRTVLRTGSHFPEHIAASYQALFTHEFLCRIAKRVGMIANWDFRPKLKELKMPILYFGGTRDVLVPVYREVRVLEENARNFRAEVVKKLPHPLLLTHPEESAKVLFDFYASIKEGTDGD